MAIPAEVARPDVVVEHVRQPGDFARHPETGAPWVAHPTETTKGGWPGTRAELVTMCAARGIVVPEKATKADLQRLLGPKPRKVLYGRPSSLGKQIENTTNLQKWSERAIALGLWVDGYVDDGQPLILDVLTTLPHAQWTLDDPEARPLLDAIAIKAKNRAQAGLAAERGTHGHELAEDHDTEADWIERVTRGEDLGLPSEVQYALVAAWAKMLDAFDVEILATEATCVDDVWRQAGTLDRICRLRRDTTFVTVTAQHVTLPAGWVGVLDIKTGKLRVDTGGFVARWHGYAVQCASYAQSLRYDVETDQRSPWEWEIDQRWAIIAHLDIGAALDGLARCRLVLVDLEAGRQAGALCVTAREWERRTDVFSIPTDDLSVTVPVRSTLPLGVEAAAPVPPPGTVEQPAPVEAPNTSAGAESPGRRAGARGGRDAPGGNCLPPGVQAAKPDDDERRAELLTRFKALTKAQQAEFRARSVSVGDYDAIAAALDDIEHPPTVVDMARERMAADAARDVERDVAHDAPDEGAPVGDADFAPLETAWAALGDDAKAWFRRLVAEASAAGVDFRAQQCKTVRRYEVYRGLIALAGWLDADNDVADEVLVALVWAAAGTDDAVRFANVTPGHALGSLDATEAAAFARLAARLVAGTANVVAEPTGRLALVAV